jgi:hypothetical protein
LILHEARRWAAFDSIVRRVGCHSDNRACQTCLAKYSTPNVQYQITKNSFFEISFAFFPECSVVDPLSFLTRLVLPWRRQTVNVEHVRTLRAKPLQPGCPHCGGALDDYVYKTGPKTGNAFRGCTRFPACRYRIELQSG